MKNGDVKKQTKKSKQPKQAGVITEEVYLKDRLENQLNWYEEKSSYYKTFYHRTRFIEILCASTIPFVAALEFPYANWVAGGLGVIIAFAAGINTLYKSQENWIEFRTTTETLKHEKFLYLSQTGPYGEANRFHLLVPRVEGLISKENSNWGGYSLAKNESSDKDK